MAHFNFTQNTYPNGQGGTILTGFQETTLLTTAAVPATPRSSIPHNATHSVLGRSTGGPGAAGAAVIINLPRAHIIPALLLL